MVLTPSYVCRRLLPSQIRQAIKYIEASSEVNHIDRRITWRLLFREKSLACKIILL